MSGFGLLVIGYCVCDYTLLWAWDVIRWGVGGSS